MNTAPNRATTLLAVTLLFFQIQLITYSVYALEESLKCERCHTTQPEKVPLPQRTTFCENCHTPAFEIRDISQVHTSHLVDPPESIKRDADCMRCHVKLTCTSCHQAHPSPTSTDCVKCHIKTSISPHISIKETHPPKEVGCSSCHDVHKATFRVLPIQQKPENVTQIEEMSPEEAQPGEELPGGEVAPEQPPAERPVGREVSVLLGTVESYLIQPHIELLRPVTSLMSEGMSLTILLLLTAIMIIGALMARSMTWREGSSE